MRDFEASPIWAITSYFDPFRRGHRADVYREFRRRLTIPLAAVELSFGSTFDLGLHDAEILIQLESGSILWQKERLLNLALQALPPHVEAVVWLDGDVVFLREDWPKELLRRLEDFPLIQPFRHLYYLEEGQRPEDRREDCGYDSAAFKVAAGSFPEEAHRKHGLSQSLRYAPGMAWAARRDTLAEHGFYDCGVLGSGDKLMFSAACGRWMECADSLSITGPYRRHYADWAQRFSNSLRGRISFLEGDLLHLWHGDLASRRYVERLLGFERFQFDPNADLHAAAGEAWHWNSDKPEMHAFVRQQLAEMLPKPRTENRLIPVSTPRLATP